MPKQCTVPRCKSVAEAGCRVGFHKFPLKKPELLKKWTSPIAPLKKPGWAPTSATSVCSLHFEEHFLYLCNPTRISLRENAYPTIFPPFSSRSPNIVLALPELQPDNGTDPLAVAVDPLDVQQGSLKVPFFSDLDDRKQEEITDTGQPARILSSITNSLSDCDTWASTNSYTGQHCSESCFPTASSNQIHIDSQHIKQSPSESDSELDDIEAILSRSSEQAGVYNSVTISCTTSSESMSDSSASSVEDEFLTYSHSPSAKSDMQTTAKRKADHGHHSQKPKLPRLLNDTCRRLMQCNMTPNELLGRLRRRGLQETAVNVIRDNFIGVISEMFDRESKSKRKANLPEDQYQAAVRAFTMTVRFFSGRAYDYLRNHFPNSLPQTSFPQNWMRTKNFEPGYSNEVLTALSHRFQTFKIRNPAEKLLCSLIFGNMDISKTVEYDPVTDRYWGYVNFGTAGEFCDMNFRNTPVASDAVVLTVVGINDFFRIPFAYLFTASLSIAEQSRILTDALHLLHATGFTVANVTFDGLLVNPDACHILGASLITRDLRPYFPHPDTAEDTFIVYDTNVMAWLVASYLCHKKVLYYKDKEIKWQYIAELEKLRIRKGLPTSLEILGKDSSARVFTEATAAALEAHAALRNETGGLEYPQLAGCQETVKFIWLFAKTLSLFNSNNLSQTGLKRPLSKDNALEVLGFAAEMRDYIWELRLPSTGERIVKGPGATGFLGFLADLINIERLYYKYIETDVIKFLPVYKMSLEHSDRFFELIRHHSSPHKSAPTQKQFYESFRHLLLNSSFTAGNRIDLVSISVLEICSRARADSKRSLSSVPLRTRDKNAARFIRLNPIVDNVLEHIAEHVTQQVGDQLKCLQCIAALKDSSFSESDFLQHEGRRLHPPPSVLNICSAAERSFRADASGGKSVQYYVSSIARMLNFDSLFCKLDPHHKCSAELSPALHLVKNIAECYLTVRFNHQGTQFRRILPHFSV